MTMAQGPRGLSLGVYFFGVLLLFGFFSLSFNLQHTTAAIQELTVVGAALSSSVTSKSTEAVVVQRAPRRSVDERGDYSLSGLECSAYGGPSLEASQEMVYWQEIPQDNRHVSPFRKPGGDEYMTFEPDHGGFNNIRMAMETVLALSFAMGRTLVLPPAKKMYLLNQGKQKGKQQRKDFGFDDFFHMQAIDAEHAGLDIISMKTYLEREAGKFRYKDGSVAWPPHNQTAWDGKPLPEIEGLFHWLRKVSHVTIWTPEKCQAAFPASNSHEDVQELISVSKDLTKNMPKWETYIGKPVPIDGTLKQRMSEHRAGRKELCLYNETMQNAIRLHFPTDHNMGARLLTHFYSLLFFQDYQQDLWLKRFVRDHVRYIDEIQCAAARVVHAVRQRAPVFDSFHIRRGDFQYKKTRVSAEDLRDMAMRKIAPNSTIYIATDERDKKFFAPMAKVYNLLFLDDFSTELGDVNSNYYGMIDQLIASRGRTFFGCWFSTFTGYINRLRGYHASKERGPGFEQGIVPNTWYYALPDRFDHMQTYYPVKQVFYAREFPASWRLLEYDMPQFHERIKEK